MHRFPLDRCHCGKRVRQGWALRATSTPEGIPIRHYKKLTTSHPQKLAELAVGLGRFNVKPRDEWLHVFEAEVAKKVYEFSPSDLSNVIWAFAVWERMPEAEVRGLIENQVYCHVTSFTHDHLAKLCWSCAQLSYRPSVLPCVWQATEDTLDQAEAEGLATILWAMAKLNCKPSADQASAFLQASQRLMATANSQQLSRMIWAVARLGLVPSSEWLDSFLTASYKDLPHFDSKCLSLNLWALAMLGKQPRVDWILVAEDRIRETFNDFQAAELTCVVWALGRLKGPNNLHSIAELLKQQEKFLERDFQILSDPKLLKVFRVLKGQGQ